MLQHMLIIFFICRYEEPTKLALKRPASFYSIHFV